VAATGGIGARALHATNQMHIAGPANVIALQITADPSPDLPIPDRSYTFGTLAAAQALAAHRVLTGRRRPVLRVHLGKNIEAGLMALLTAIQRPARPARPRTTKVAARPTPTKKAVAGRTRR
jgi:transaldolase/glucose-6-phosphate isomerase